MAISQPNAGHVPLPMVTVEAPVSSGPSVAVTYTSSTVVPTLSVKPSVAVCVVGQDASAILPVRMAS